MFNLTVPVVSNFDSREVIGHLTITDKSKLPPIPEFCFSLGYKLLNSETKEYELVCVSPMMDESYKGYLETLL